MKKVLISTLLFFLAFFSLGFGEVPGKKRRPLAGRSNQVILDWNLAAYEAMGGATYQHSLLASRLNAMTHLAMHDALNAVVSHFEPYAFREKDPEADPIAAVASAAHAILTASFPDQATKLNEKLTRSLAGIAEGPARTRGLALGQKAAKTILALRTGDDADRNPISELKSPSVPGTYQVVPPMAFVFAPHWRTMKPFGLSRVDQFRSAGYPALSSRQYVDSFNEVKLLGAKSGSRRSLDQTAYAKFWYEFSEIGWNRIARTVAAKKLDLAKTARLFALLNMALADAYTAGWDSKFHHNFWRPYTAIHAAEKDGNAETEADTTWEPLMPTPPIHDYPSTHSALGNAAAAVLASVLGDATSFTVGSATAEPTGYQRSFKSFSQAADENADSRVMAGIHFRFSCEAGQELGAQVGKWTAQNYLKPSRQTN